MGDIILRPTEQKPGFYETPEGIVPVVRHEDGKAYTMLFFETGEGQKNMQEGDVMFLGTYLKNMTTIYPEGSAMVQESTVVSEPLNIPESS